MGTIIPSTYRKDDSMNNFRPPALPVLCFAKIYENNIESKIKAIDLFLKTTPTPYNPEDISSLLHIELNDLLSIMKQENISSLDMVAFFKVIQTSSSYICKLIQRQWEHAGVKCYTPEIISYIYELNLDKVRLAFKQCELVCVESHNLKELFSYIYVPIMNLK